MIIQVGQAIGALWTILLLIADSLIGARLLTWQGRSAWRRFQDALTAGRVPHNEVLDGVMVVVGGALLLTPGFITDVVRPAAAAAADAGGVAPGGGALDPAPRRGRARGCLRSRPRHRQAGPRPAARRRCGIAEPAPAPPTWTGPATSARMISASQEERAARRGRELLRQRLHRLQPRRARDLRLRARRSAAKRGQALAASAVLFVGGELGADERRRAGGGDRKLGERRSWTASSSRRSPRSSDGGWRCRPRTRRSSSTPSAVSPPTAPDPRCPR